VEWQYIGYGNGLLSNRKQNKCNPQVEQHLPFSSYFSISVHGTKAITKSFSTLQDLKLGGGNVSKKLVQHLCNTVHNSTRPQLGNLIA